jgi:hypothetical protein
MRLCINCPWTCQINCQKLLKIGNLLQNHLQKFIQKAAAAQCQSYLCCDAEVKFAPYSFVAHTPQYTKHRRRPERDGAVNGLDRLSAITVAAEDIGGTCCTYTVHPRKLATKCRAQMTPLQPPFSHPKTTLRVSTPRITAWPACTSLAEEGRVIPAWSF